MLEIIFILRAIDGIILDIAIIKAGPISLHKLERFDGALGSIMAVLRRMREARC